MSLGTSNRDGGKTSESGHLRTLSKMVSGDVISGLAVSQRAAGANMSVDVAIGDAFVRRSDGTYAHPVFNDAIYNQTVTTADPSNPRNDILVIYVDYGQTPSTAVSNNTNGVVKIKIVAGTPAGSPADPSAAAIQASVGSGNPYSMLARIRVTAGATSVSNSMIDDLRTLITNLVNTINTNALQDGAVTDAKLRILCAYMGYPSVTQAAMSDSAFTKMNLDIEDYDLGNNFASGNVSGTTPRFVAPTNGIYHFDAAMSAANNATRLFASIYKNGVEAIRTTNGSWSGTTGNRSLGGADMKLAVNDFVELYGWRTPAGQPDNPVASKWTTFITGHLITRI